VPDFVLELELGQGNGKVIIGIDEAGRAPLAGPVTAGAAWLDAARLDPALACRIDDSKKLTPQLRSEIFQALSDPATACAVVAVGEASVEEIDRINILQASLLAMQRAAEALIASLGALTPARLVHGALIDGNQLPKKLPCPARAVVQGDGLSLSIAAASIVAKVTRDRAMAAYAEQFPGYGWERNRGYATPEHRAGIARLGITPLHRRSFRPVREALAQAS
jgi:ribonuclease HII